MAVQGQGLPGELAQGLKLGAAGPGHVIGEDPPVQKLAGLPGEGVAVPHQGQGCLPGVAPVEEVAEVSGGLLERHRFFEGRAGGSEDPPPSPQAPLPTPFE